MEEIFDDILDRDEKVIKAFKPKKSVMYFKSFFVSILVQLFMYGIIVIGALSEVEVVTKTETILLITIPIILIILFVSVQSILLHFAYKNLYYAYTNTRIIIRKGIIGVDFKSLEIKMIGASDVHVGIIDKLMRKNTGTIVFGSSASPIISSSGSGSFILSNIEKPYELFKEIKNHISDMTNEKKEEQKATKTK